MKKTKHGNIDDNEKEQLKKYRKKKLYVITLMMKKTHIKK